MIVYFENYFSFKIPYAHSPSVRKLSKISTLYLGEFTLDLYKIKLHNQSISFDFCL